MSSEEVVPLINDSPQDSNLSYYTDDAGESEYITEYGDGSQAAQRAHRPTGATVTCRVCDASVQLEGRNTQHVVKCHNCDEATPIRPAPPGKKYVRCPCNCLLICKASSTRIACPRNNCRRVITLDTAGQRDPASAIRAPTGSCRVSCAHCNEIFLFNTLTNSLATCPHCRKHSAVGPFARRRSILFFVLAAVLAIFSVLFTLLTKQSGLSRVLIYPAWVLLYFVTVLAGYKSFNYWMTPASHVIGPLESV
ncbi:unnamed protein product [Caenorhabditis angaria]|uniref:Phosphatidylinositol-4,5-bisphosphate 4-phosphatase n=1 Tax=Caenorhabditis angaria TaxID=860376 RepID=A0A9P1IGM9_9PELO|nr:unnamed protein product [Caenorhabditis angaria]